MALATEASINGVVCSTAAERVHDCEQALDAGLKAVNEQQLVLEGYQAQNKRLQQSLDFSLMEDSKAKAWYRDPKVIAPVAFILGVALGAYAVKKAQ